MSAHFYRSFPFSLPTAIFLFFHFLLEVFPLWGNAAWWDYEWMVRTMTSFLFWLYGKSDFAKRGKKERSSYLQGEFSDWSTLGMIKSGNQRLGNWFPYNCGCSDAPESVLDVSRSKEPHPTLRTAALSSITQLRLAGSQSPDMGLRLACPSSLSSEASGSLISPLPPSTLAQSSVSS